MTRVRFVALAVLLMGSNLLIESRDCGADAGLVLLSHPASRLGRAAEHVVAEQSQSLTET